MLLYLLRLFVCVLDGVLCLLVCVFVCFTIYIFRPSEIISKCAAWFTILHIHMEVCQDREPQKWFV